MGAIGYAYADSGMGGWYDREELRDREERAGDAAKERLIASPSFQIEAIENSADDVLAAFSAPDPKAALGQIVCAWADRYINDWNASRDPGALDRYVCAFECDDARRKAA